MVNFYELNESEVSTGSFDPGCIIFCKDSGNIYFTTTDGSAAKTKMSDTLKILTEAQRKSMLAPINGKMYFCYDTGKLWMYYNDWACLNATDENSFDIEQVIVPKTGSVTVSDNRITAGASAEFVPDASVADLITNIAVTTAAGSATITGTTSYDVSGTLKIK